MNKTTNHDQTTVQSTVITKREWSTPRLQTLDFQMTEGGLSTGPEGGVGGLPLGSSLS